MCPLSGLDGRSILLSGLPCAKEPEADLEGWTMGTRRLSSWERGVSLARSHGNVTAPPPSLLPQSSAPIQRTSGDAADPAASCGMPGRPLHPSGSPPRARGRACLFIPLCYTPNVAPPAAICGMPGRSLHSPTSPPHDAARQAGIGEEARPCISPHTCTQHPIDDRLPPSLYWWRGPPPRTRRGATTRGFGGWWRAVT
jgi:hypothetical protein